MKKHTIVIASGIVLILSLFYADKYFFMPDRILNNTWEYEKGDYHGDVIDGKYYKIEGGYLISDEDTFKIKYQYLDFLIVKEVSSNGSTTYLKQ